MIPKRHIRMLNDEVAKKLFTNEVIGKRLAARLICKTLDLEIDADELAKNLEYKHPNTSLVANVVDSVSDVSLESNDFVCDIEINLSNGLRNDRKNKSYICGFYLRQLPSSKEYNRLKKIVQINLDYFDYFHANLFHYVSYFTEVHTGMLETKDVEIHHINLAKLNNVDYNDIVSDKEALETLLYFFVCEDKTVLEKVYKGDDFMHLTKEEADKIIEGIDRLLYYDQEELNRLDREDAIKEGLEEGEKNKAKQIAKSMIQKDFDNETISDITGISIETIEALSKE
ncbi:MAG: Rpn family recombination-promoting nuclease/putative transposase [Bacilli bacterium]|nr:Rpn family recombination-promoting nuclease/putative transposase [Bacilli bacterium]